MMTTTTAYDLPEAACALATQHVATGQVPFGTPDEIRANHDTANAAILAALGIDDMTATGHTIFGDTVTAAGVYADVYEGQMKFRVRARKVSCRCGYAVACDGTGSTASPLRTWRHDNADGELCPASGQVAMVPVEHPTFIAVEGAYMHLASFTRGQEVVVGGIHGRRTGIVTVTQRESDSGLIGLAYIVVDVDGVAVHVHATAIIHGWRWVAPVLPANRRTDAATLAKLTA